MQDTNSISRKVTSAQMRLVKQTTCAEVVRIIPLHCSELRCLPMKYRFGPTSTGFTITTRGYNDALTTGMFDATRFVKNTKPIRKISFSEAAELAYFGAKILHPTCVQPAKEANIPIRLKYTMDPDAQGTLIVGDVESGKLQAIAAKDNMVVVNIHSKRSVTPNVFLKKTLEVFEDYNVAIDLMTTTEVAVAVCAEQTSNTEKIMQSL